MATGKEYFEFIKEQLSGIGDVSYRAMMGEYIVYYKGKVIGGIYDDRFLVKPTKSAQELLPDASLELPYEGAKEMLSVDEIDNKDLMKTLFNAIFDELPLKKRNLS